MGKKFIAMVMVAGLGLAGCSSFDREGSIKQFTDSGMSREVAECLVDGIVDKVGEDRATSDADLTPEEEALVAEVSVSCLTAE